VRSGIRVGADRPWLHVFCRRFKSPRRSSFRSAILDARLHLPPSSLSFMIVVGDWSIGLFCTTSLLLVWPARIRVLGEGLMAGTLVELVVYVERGSERRTRWYEGAHLRV